MKTAIAAAAIALCATLSAGQLVAAEFDVEGAAKVVGNFERLGQSKVITVPVSVDLFDVSRGGRPVVLGAYVARIEFDPQAVTFVRSLGGTNPAFAKSPFSTNANKANLDGVVKLSYVQLDQNAPAGFVNVARVMFREKTEGGAESIKLTIESLASTLDYDASGNYLQNLAIRVEEKE